MQIGRKIFYELATGNVILDTGERTGSVVETTIEQDFQTYIALQPYQKSAVGVLQLVYGQDGDNFGKYPFHVDTTTNTIVWDVANPIGASLADLQNAKIEQLADFYKRSSATFQSSALGTVHTYLADDTSIGKFNAQYTFVNSADYDGQPFKWFTVEEGGVLHTKEQFTLAWLEGRSFLASQFDKWDDLVKHAKIAQSKNEVDLIVW